MSEPCKICNDRIKNGPVKVYREEIKKVEFFAEVVELKEKLRTQKATHEGDIKLLTHNMLVLNKKFRTSQKLYKKWFNKLRHFKRKFEKQWYVCCCMKSYYSVTNFRKHQNRCFLVKALVEKKEIQVIMEEE